MRTLSLNEIQSISGAGAKEIFGTVGSLAGAYYGAGIGGVISVPFSLAGFVYSVTASNGILWSGVALSGGVIAVGILGGALVGGALGAGLGFAGGYLADKVIEQA